MQNRTRSTLLSLLVAALFLAVATAGARVPSGRGRPAKPAARAPKPSTRPAPAMAFTPAELDLAPGETYPVTLFVPSPTGKYHNATLTFTGDRGVTVQTDARWTGRVPPWGVKVFPKITAAAEAAGPAKVTAALAPGGSATLDVAIKRPEVKLIPRIHELRIQVTNPLRGRPLKGRVGVSNPDRFLGDIRSRLLNIEPGATQEVVIPLPGAAPVESETYAFTVTLQTWAGYREQTTHPLKFPPQRPAADEDKGKD